MSSSLERGTFFDAKEKVWSGHIASDVFDKDISIGQISLSILGADPQKVIQICDTTGERLTCENLIQLSIRLARIFKHKLGLQQEDVIGIMASNTTYVAPVALATFLIGAILNPIHHTSDKSTVRHIFGLTKPKVVFCDKEAYDALVEGLGDLDCKIYTLKGHIDGLENVRDLLQESKPEDDFLPEVLRNGGDQTAIIMCSSGTTGLPKGVCISHRSFVNKLYNDFSFHGADDVMFTFSTLHWISGMFILVESFIKGASRVITDKPFTPEVFLELIEKYKITQVLGPPSHASLALQCSDIERRDLSSVRTYVCGGSAVPTTMSNKLKEYLSDHCLSEAYGLTELGGLSNLNRWPKHKEGSVGQLNPNTKAKICSEDGISLGIGQKGEIYLSSQFKWKGYYGNPEMTQITLDAEGWIRTGDLGYFDEDGFLFVSGRKKEILKYKNFHVSPIEIEETIMKMMGIVEVCVFGIPDEVVCDLPAAAVVKSPECNLTEEDVCKTVASCLSEAKHLHGGVYFFPELPKTPSGKIQRQKLRLIVDEMRKIK